MHTKWIGLTIAGFCWLMTSEALGGSAALPVLISDPLETIARAYPTPKALAQFLRKTVAFKTDEELFAELDYWQTPEELLRRRAGDCEDYALLAQAILERLGIEAYVFSIYGQDGYAHTVCVFVESGRYNVINQDRLRYYRAKDLETLAWQLYPSWTHGALAERSGTRGRSIRLITNPSPQSSLAASDSFFSFP